MSGHAAATPPGSPAPLRGVRVLDLSRVLAGPWAGQMLADYGADVIKVERPGCGDDTRQWGPPWWQGEGKRQSAYFLSANRGKRSIAIDLGTAEGAAQVRDLARHADVLIENYKVGQLARYGLDHASLAALNPALIYCSITGFGQTGPMAKMAGYDVAVQAMGGLMSITGEPAASGGQPQKAGVAVVDLFTGVYAVTAILAALHERATTGKGRWIDAALLDVQVAMLANQASNHLVSGGVPERLGNAHPNVVPYQVFETADGHLVLAVGNDGQFQAFCRAAGHPDLGLHEEWRTNPLRVQNRTALIAQISGWMRERTTDDWCTCLATHGVPCAPILDVKQVFSHQQVLLRGMRSEIDGVPQVAHPLLLDGVRPAAIQGPPALDAHGDLIRAALAAGHGWPPAPPHVPT